MDTSTLAIVIAYINKVGEKISQSGITVNESYDISEGKLNTATVTLDGDITAHIPDGVVTVGNKAFKENTTITKVIMPNSVTSIGDSAFVYCRSLKSITIPDSVTSIGENAFNNCTSLTSITIPDSVTSIEGFAFDTCTSLTSIVIPDSVTSIGHYIFAGCESLTDIYYTGTQAEWESITGIGIGIAGIPAGATIHYEYTPN